MSNQITAQSGLKFIPPDFNPLVQKFINFILPFYIKNKTPLTEITAENVETLADLYQQFESGKIRFLFAFRHPSTNDPFVIGYLLSQLLPKVAKKQNIILKNTPHAHFIYDRGIPLWAGEYVGWLYAKLGGIPIQRGKLDRLALKTIRDLFANGKLPMMAAPEGGTNGHSEIISPLEPGIPQMGFWCMEDLAKNNRQEQVFIVPVGIQYHYIDEPWQSLKSLLGQLEKDCGFNPAQIASNNNDDTHATLYRRLYQLGEYLLTLMEDFYSKFYHRDELKLENRPNSENFVDLGVRSPDDNQLFSERLNRLLDTALKVAEEYFSIQGKGSFIDRCRRLEQAGWDYIYRDDLTDVESLSALKKGLADRIAEEADLRMWHMRLVENFVAVTGRYIIEKPSAERFAETVMLTWDVITKIKGGSTFPRPNLGKQRVQVTVGNPISVSDRWEVYQSSRKNAKQAVADLTQDLQNALESMIKG